MRLKIYSNEYKFMQVLGLWLFRRIVILIYLQKPFISNWIQFGAFVYFLSLKLSQQQKR